jgi:hypothetical protein
MTTVMGVVLSSSEWVIPALLLFVVAWSKFNTPPTNRSGTTFALFFFGVIFYYALILALWLMVSISGIGFGRFVPLELADAEAREQIAQYAPIFAALIIVVASQFPRVNRIDTAARTFCISLAAIPREADRLSVELAQGADFEPPTEQLRRHVTKFISENINSKAVNFNRDGTLSARFTRAVALHWLFIRPKEDGTPLEFSTSAYGKSAYSTIMNFHEAMANRAHARYEEMIRESLTYFTSADPTKELEEALNKTITELSNLVCSLIARYVLYCDVTRRGRRQRLSSMGFDATHPIPTFGLDQWAATILAVVILSIGMMVLMPGMNHLGAPKILTIAITFAVSIGFAVMAAVVVAQRFIERHEGEKPGYPPFAELLAAALIAVGLSMAIRIAFPLVLALIEGNSAAPALQDVVSQFWQRLPGLITPFTCTISLGLLCSYVDLWKGTSLRVAAIGAIGNGLAFLVAGFLVGTLLDDNVLAQFFYVDLGQARHIIIANTGITGAVIGVMVLAAFRKSERARKDDAAHARLAGGYTSSPVESLEPFVPSSSGGAAQNFGAYSRLNVERLEGCYVCFRPGFTVADLINAYLVAIRWDEAESCLMFEEQGRADASHTQKGRIYIPDGCPFMNLVTIEKGAIRLMTVSRPENQEPARGLVMTLSNPSGMHFTPASAPIVLKRVPREIPQLGFIRPDSPDYEAYRRELETVMPEFGLLSMVPRPTAEPEAGPARSAEDVRLSVVR